jgi:3-phenylpropionate/trans-cinnamate dioxygenase ferredoxin reductase subunit
MPRYDYLIVGGGMTADAAVRGIRKHDEKGSVGLVSSERYPPYNRPPLSKGLWIGKPIEKIWRGTDKFNVDLHLERTIRGLDVERKIARDDQGTEYAYGKLLLATGATSRRLPFGENEIIYYRFLDDYKRLQEMAGKKSRFAVIGSGFIGSEIAAALATNGKQVSLIFPENGIYAHSFPQGLVEYLNQYYTDKGVTLYGNHTIKDVKKKGEQSVVMLEDVRTGQQKEIEVDGIIAGIGVQPNTVLAEAAGLEVNNGIVVGTGLTTSHRDVYAAGDVAAFYNPALEMRMRVEHEDNANTMGTAAGEAMAGASIQYTHLPYFYSDLFELGYEAIGELKSDYAIFEDWSEPYQKGVVYYLKDERVRGVLLWNVWSQVNNARELIAERGSFGPYNLKGRLPR